MIELLGTAMVTMVVVAWSLLGAYGLLRLRSDLAARRPRPRPRPAIPGDRASPCRDCGTLIMVEQESWNWQLVDELSWTETEDELRGDDQIITTKGKWELDETAQRCDLCSAIRRAELEYYGFTRS